MSGNDQSKSRRGRPSVFRAEEIDKHIVATARSMFLREGYDMVTMERIAATASISKGTLYARHPSKERLFATVVENAISDWSRASSKRDHLLSSDIAERLRYHAQAIVMSIRRPDVIAFQRLVLSVRDRFPNAANAMYESGYKYIVGIIASDIEIAAERDGVPVRDANAIAEILVSSITGKQMQDGLNGPELDIFANKIIDLLLMSRVIW